MRSRFGIKILFPVAAALLLSTALTAWGVSIILTGDAGGTINCTTGTVTVTDGSITATVPTVCIPTGGGGGGGSGPFTLSVVKSGSGTVASDVGGIACGTTCTSAAQTSGTVVTLSATAGALAGWSGGGCSGTGTCPVTLTANTTVTAIFGPLNLTVTTAGSGTGTVTSSPAGTGGGISCTTGSATGCSDAYNTVTPVTLTATPGTGTFAGWSGGGCSGTASTCTVTMNASKAVTATFNTAVSCSTPPAAGRVVSIVDTGTITSNWAQQAFAPLPSTITAFKVTVPSGFSRRDDIVAIKGSTTARAPMLILSTQPGCADVFQGSTQPYCKVSALDGAKIKMNGNLSDTIYYCKLPPGDYYINAFNQATVGGAYTCTNTTNCRFMVSRSANY